jgi:predicted ATP-grasp superfamily ATP-dependent carboligase
MNALLRDKKILLATTNLGLTFPIIRVLNRIGVRPDVLGPDKRSLLWTRGLLCRRYIGYPLDGLGYDHNPAISSFSDAFVGLLNDVQRRHGYDVVLPVDYTVILPLSTYRGQLATDIRLTPFLDEPQLRALNDKWRFSRLLLDLGIPQPETRLLDGSIGPGELDLEFPVIVKPTNRGGCSGIRTFQSREALLQYLDEANLDLSSSPLLCQQWMPGRDLQVFVFGTHGRLRAWSMCYMDRAGAREFVADPEVLGHCERLVAETGYHGPGLIDVRHDRQASRVGFLEINLRFPASTFYHYLAGVNYVELALLAGLGQADAFAFTPPGGQRIARSPAETLLSKLNQLTSPPHRYA